MSTDGSRSAIERARTALGAAFADRAAPATVAENRADGDIARQLVGFQRLALVVTIGSLCIAGCSLAAGVVGGLNDRKRPFSLLRLAGVPLAALRRSLALETAVPLFAVAAVAVGMGFLAAALFLRSQLEYTLLRTGPASRSRWSSGWPRRWPSSPRRFRCSAASPARRPPATNDRRRIGLRRRRGRAARSRRGQHVEVGARIGLVGHEVGRCALLDAGQAQPRPRGPGRGRQRRLGRQAGRVQCPHLRPDRAVGDAATGVGAGEHRHPGLEGGAHHCPRRGVQPAHRRGVGGEPLLPAAAKAGKFSTLIRVGTTAVPRAAMRPMSSSVRPVPCSMQSMPASMRSGSASVPKVCAVTRAPSACAASIAARIASAGHSGARSPTPRSIQSPTSLTHPSPRRAWTRTSAARSAGVELDRQSGDVAARGGQVAAGADDAGQVGLVVQGPGVDR